VWPAISTGPAATTPSAPAPFSSACRSFSGFSARTSCFSRQQRSSPGCIASIGRPNRRAAKVRKKPRRDGGVSWKMPRGERQDTRPFERAEINRRAASGLLDVQYLHCLGQSVHGLLMLAGLVQRLPFRAELLHIGSLRVAKLRVLGHGLVDLL